MTAETWASLVAGRQLTLTVRRRHSRLSSPAYAWLLRASRRRPPLRIDVALSSASRLALIPTPAGGVVVSDVEHYLSTMPLWHRLGEPQEPLTVPLEAHPSRAVLFADLSAILPAKPGVVPTTSTDGVAPARASGSGVTMAARPTERTEESA